jgi:TolB-like protein
LKPPALALPDKPSIAVLPFQNMSGDPEQEYFADGMAKDIITALSKLRWFFVIARNSTFAYKGKSLDVRQVARELGVRYVLEGSVRKAGDRVRISAQLVDATTGNHIWAQRYDREIADVFAMQDEIAESVVAAIEPQLYAAENLRIETKPPESLDAWECVIRALWHIGRVTKDDTEQARELMPVTWPAGRDMLSMKPKPSGSVSDTLTIGIVAVAHFNAKVATTVLVTSTSGFSRTNSSARAGIRELSPSA